MSIFVEVNNSIEVLNVESNLTLGSLVNDGSRYFMGDEQLSTDISIRSMNLMPGSLITRFPPDSIIVDGMEIPQMDRAGLIEDLFTNKNFTNDGDAVLLQLEAFETYDYPSIDIDDLLFVINSRIEILWATLISTTELSSDTYELMMKECIDNNWAYGIAVLVEHNNPDNTTRASVEKYLRKSEDLDDSTVATFFGIDGPDWRRRSREII